MDFRSLRHQQVSFASRGLRHSTDEIPQIIEYARDGFCVVQLPLPNHLLHLPAGVGPRDDFLVILRLRFARGQPFGEQPDVDLAEHRGKAIGILELDGRFAPGDAQPIGRAERPSERADEEAGGMATLQPRGMGQVHLGAHDVKVLDGTRMSVWSTNRWRENPVTGIGYGELASRVTDPRCFIPNSQLAHLFA